MYNDSKNTLCVNCAHSDACNLKRDFETLKTTTDDLGKLLENKKFKIEVSCSCYLRKEETIR